MDINLDLENIKDARSLYSLLRFCCDDSSIIDTFHLDNFNCSDFIYFLFTEKLISLKVYKELNEELKNKTIASEELFTIMFGYSSDIILNKLDVYGCIEYFISLYLFSSEKTDEVLNNLIIEIKELLEEENILDENETICIQNYPLPANIFNVGFDKLTLENLDELILAGIEVSDDALTKDIFLKIKDILSKI